MRAADYIIQTLAAAGIDTAFLVQGAANNDLLDAIAKQDKMKYVCTAHEQAAGFAAEGWAKVMGKPSLVIATSGPGGQNLATPIANCFYDSVPCIFIVGQVFSNFMRRDDSLRQLGFQEWPASEVFKPITKLSMLVRSAQDVPYAIARAIAECSTGRPGPVLIELPIDVQRGEVDACLWLEPQETDVRSYKVFNQRHRQINSLIADLRKSERPALLIGGGVRSPRAQEALRTLAELLPVPFFPTWNALDVVTSDWDRYAGRVGTYGGAGRNFGIQNCDLLLAVGCRLSGRITGGRPETFARAARRYVIDVDLGLLDPKNQPQPFHENIFCDAERFLAELERVLRREIAEVGPLPDWRQWNGCCRAWRTFYESVRPEYFHGEAIHPYAFARRLSELAPANAVIVNDCGGNAVVMNHAFETKHGQRYFSNNGNSPMGFAMCAAMGAWFADPSRPVICVIGDGGMTMNSQELQTIKHYGIGIKVFILNNGCYGISRQFQKGHGGKMIATGPDGYSVPDFVKVADAYGVTADWMDQSVDVDEQIREAFASDGPYIVDVRCPDFCTYEPRIAGPSTPIEDMDPRLPRDEFRANMLIDPLPGWETGGYL